MKLVSLLLPMRTEPLATKLQCDSGDLVSKFVAKHSLNECQVSALHWLMKVGQIGCPFDLLEAGAYMEGKYNRGAITEMLRMEHSWQLHFEGIAKEMMIEPSKDNYVISKLFSPVKGYPKSRFQNAQFFDGENLVPFSGTTEVIKKCQELKKDISTNVYFSVGKEIWTVCLFDEGATLFFDFIPEFVMYEDEKFYLSESSEKMSCLGKCHMYKNGICPATMAPEFVESSDILLFDSGAAFVVKSEVVVPLSVVQVGDAKVAMTKDGVMTAHVDAKTVLGTYNFLLDSCVVRDVSDFQPVHSLVIKELKNSVTPQDLLDFDFNPRGGQCFSVNYPFNWECAVRRIFPNVFSSVTVKSVFGFNMPLQFYDVPPIGSKLLFYSDLVRVPGSLHRLMRDLRRTGAIFDEDEIVPALLRCGFSVRGDELIPTSRLPYGYDPGKLVSLTPCLLSMLKLFWNSLVNAGVSEEIVKKIVMHMLAIEKSSSVSAFGDRHMICMEDVMCGMEFCLDYRSLYERNEM